MIAFEFSVIASGLDHETEDFEDRLFEAGCADATISIQKGVIVFDFAREGRSFEAAVQSAMADVEKGGASIERIEPDFLVSLSEIAKRAGLTRAAIHNYAKGERAADFPLPVARVTTDSALWDWVDVSRWLFEQRKIGEDATNRAKVIRGLNLRLFERKIEPAA